MLQSTLWIKSLLQKKIKVMKRSDPPNPKKHRIRCSLKQVNREKETHSSKWSQAARSLHWTLCHDGFSDFHTCHKWGKYRDGANRTKTKQWKYTGKLREVPHKRQVFKKKRIPKQTSRPLSFFEQNCFARLSPLLSDFNWANSRYFDWPYHWFWQLVGSVLVFIQWNIPQEQDKTSPPPPLHCTG